MAQPIYKGEEKKFAVRIEAAGFSMDDDDFEIEVASPKDSVTAVKSGDPDEHGVWTNEDGSLVIFSETAETTVPSDEPGGEPAVSTGREWFCIVDTEYLSTGDLLVIATAHVPDEKAYDGDRKEIATQKLGTLKPKNK